MPGWHDATRELQERGEVRMVGIIQEQHPDRARLFMQWKEMGWPVMVDSYDLLEVPHVPITLAIDERGIVRKAGMAMEDTARALGEFLAAEYDEPGVGEEVAAPGPPDLQALYRRARSEESAEAWKAWGDAIAVRGGPGRHVEAIRAYERATALDPDDGMAHFRLGVAHRSRYDFGAGRSEDFRQAVEHWTRALELRPNHYIFRRRIQQYGPRLDKPYPFYDWIRTAREEIRARGEEPTSLAVEPQGSEFAEPADSFVASAGPVREPDPEGRIYRESGELIGVETVSVPARVSPGEVARFHVVFRPNEEMKAHWNNEVDDLVLWVEPPGGWSVEKRLHTYPVPRDRTVSTETRRIEVEVRAPEDPADDRVRIPAYALYYVCEDVNGICMFRRQDVELEVGVREGEG